MLRADLEKVFIEHCVGCKTHQWCTNHDEDKYIQYFTMCKNAITRTCSRVTVSQNEVPLGFQDKFVADPNISHFGRYHFPRIGAFEVYFRGKLIFSKIESMKWPHPGKVAEKIKEIQEAPPQKQLKKKVVKAKRIKSALPVKKKKGKKGRKKHLRTANKDKIVSPQSEDIQDRPVSRDQQLRGVRNYKQAELPNFSADMSQNSDYEQPVPPKDYYNPQPKPEKNYAKEDFPNSYSPTNIPINKAKEPNLILDRPKDPIQVLEKPKDPIPLQKQPTPVVKQENFPVAKSPTPMTKVVKSPSSDIQVRPTSIENIKSNPNKNPYDTSSESSSENYGYSSGDSQHGYAENDEHVDYLELMKKYPDNFKQDPEIEKFVQRNLEAEAKTKENAKEKNKESSSDYSKDYEEDERFEKNKKFVKKSEDEDEEDYSDDDYEDDKKGDKESDNEEYSDEDYEADSGHGRGAKSSSSSGKKESKGSSKKDDYEDSDFEEEQAHPLRPIDKSYNVKLPLGEESKKKITYQNMGDSSATFLIESSHPDFMSVKEADLHIEKGKKGKIQLRFAPMMNADEKKYYLYVDRNGQPWECIEIVAEYED